MRFELAVRTLCLLAVCMLTTLHAAVADPLVSHCKSVVEDDEERFHCQVRSTAGKELSNLSVTQEDGSALGFTIKPYSWTAHKTALYFLVQTGNVSSATLERFSKYLSRAAYPVGKQSMGIATAGEVFREEARLGSYRPKLSSIAYKIETMRPVKGKTVVLRSLTDAISKLANESADRKAIFVLAGANPPANGVDDVSVINQALSKNIAIYFVVQGKSGEEPSSLLNDIANKTHGGVITITDLSKSDLLTNASRAPEHIENGSVLDVDATELPDTTTLKISAEVLGEGTLTTAPIDIERQTDKSGLSLTSLFGDHLYETLAALILASGLALLGLSYISKQDASATNPNNIPNTPQTGSGNDETRILTQNWSAGQEAAAVAWLDLMDSSDPPLPLAPGSIRVGRSRDNDVQLTNRSVHRHHAILQVNDDGSVSVQDLGTKNGVFVNGSRCNECALCVDDVIELGEVKLRLTTKPS